MLASLTLHLDPLVALVMFLIGFICGWLIRGSSSPSGSITTNDRVDQMKPPSVANKDRTMWDDE